MKRVLSILGICLILVVVVISAWRLFFYRPPLLSVINNNPQIQVSITSDKLDAFRQAFSTRLVLNNISQIRFTLLDAPPDQSLSGITSSWQLPDGTKIDYSSYQTSVNKGLLDIRLWLNIDLLRQYSWTNEAIAGNLTSTFSEAVARVHTPGEIPENRQKEIDQLILSSPADLFTVVLP